MSLAAHEREALGAAAEERAGPGPATRGLSGSARVARPALARPPGAATHWSARAMAMRGGLGQGMVSRAGRAFAPRPHRAEGFKLAKDPLLIEKVRGGVGPCLHPPRRALVLRVDDKPRIQAPERSQPLLSARPGPPVRRARRQNRRPRTRGCRPPLSRTRQPPSQTLYPDQNRRPNPRLRRPIL